MEGRGRAQCPVTPSGQICREPSDRGWSTAWGLKAGEAQGWAHLAEQQLNGPQRAAVTMVSMIS